MKWSNVAKETAANKNFHFTKQYDDAVKEERLRRAWY